MPKVKIDYSNTIFYKICCKDVTVTDSYIGHTTNFVQRKHAHKNCSERITENCKLYKCIRENGGWNNWDMTIINFHDCKDIYEAKKKEQEYFKEFKATLNSVEPLPLKPPTKIIVKDNNKNSNFSCIKCNYTCNKESDWNKHLKTFKHCKSIERNEINNILSCEKCNKTFKTNPGLWKHRKIVILV